MVLQRRNDCLHGRGGCQISSSFLQDAERRSLVGRMVAGAASRPPCDTTTASFCSSTAAMHRALFGERCLSACRAACPVPHAPLATDWPSLQRAARVAYI